MLNGAKWCLAALIALIPVTADSQPSPEAAVYAALFNGRDWNLEPLAQLVVKRTSIPVPTLVGSNPEWLKEWDDVPGPLRLAAHESSFTPRPPLAPELFPQGTRFVTNDEVDSMFVPRQGAPETNWKLFRQQFAAAGWVAFSDIYFASDDALVYYEGRCGSLYGVGMYVWLHRGSAESDWVIRKRIVSWIS
ncbi:MAG: hypothetical protein Q7V01_15500 [Vicinamibacterales bacterium]|nr:hypothetical protein [Vicinamibacterales bacterium]